MVKADTETEVDTLFDYDDAPLAPQADGTFCLFVLMVNVPVGCMGIIVNS
jgi:hypothetical protein